MEPNKIRVPCGLAEAMDEFVTGETERDVDSECIDEVKAADARSDALEANSDRITAEGSI